MRCGALPLPSKIKIQHSSIDNSSSVTPLATSRPTTAGQPYHLPIKNQNSTFINRQFFLCHAVSSRCSATFIRAGQRTLFASDDVNAVWIDPGDVGLIFDGDRVEDLADGVGGFVGDFFTLAECEDGGACAGD